MVRKIFKKALKPLCIFLSLVLVFGLYVWMITIINAKSLKLDGNYDTDWKAPAKDISAGQGYVLSCENDKAALYVDYETGSFYLKNKEDGFIWYSIPQNPEADIISKGVTKTETQSELIVEYISVEDENSNSSTRVANSRVGCIQNGSISVANITDGVRVTYDFEQLELRIPVEYVLNGDTLEASIITDELEDGTKNLLISLKLLPYFGAAGNADNGYLFIPDGSGAIAEFNNGVISTSSYKKAVYGQDRAYYENNETAKNENILIPVFGTVYDEGSALMGVITSGDGGASIAAQTGNSKNFYNTVYSEMMYRIYSVGQSLYVSKKTNDISTVTHTPFGVDKFTVKYFMLSGEKASYSGMAEKYREYLIEEKGLKQSPTAPSLAVDIYGALATKANTFGITHEKMRILTSFEDAKSIIEKLENSGVNNFSVRYIGWNNNGVFNSEITDNAKPLSILGGKSGFLNLSDYLTKKGYKFFPVADTVTYQKSGNGISKRSDSAKSTNGDVALQKVYSIVTFEESSVYEPWLLIKPSLLTEVSQKFLNKYSTLGIESLSFSDIGEYIYSDFSKSDGIYKAKSVEYVEDMLRNADKSVKNLAVTGGNAYTLPYSDMVFSLPMSSSGYDIFAYDVPFVQLILHGYVSYTTPYVRQNFDMNYTLLKSIETGSDLLFSCVSDDSYPLSETRLSHLFSSESSLWMDKAAEYYKEYNSVAAKVWDSVIKKHECIEKDLFKTEYENGLSVYINYSADDITVDGITVSAGSYTVKEAE